MRKDCEVEVCSEEEGFEGAWFSAVLLDSPAKSGQKKLRVKYMTLLSDDSVTPLIESVKQKFVRPVPPETETLYNDVVLEEGSIVEADHKDGWWTGFVLKKEEDCFLVYFDSPPDIIKFERNQLRPHLEWAKWKWVRPKNKVLDKSMFCSGTMVEIRSVETKVVWFPTMIVKEIEKDGDEKKFIVKDWIKHLSCNGDEETLNTTVNFRCVRPTPPPSSPGVYTLLESVEAFHGSVWYQGLVTAVLSDKCYSVSLEATKEVHVFKHSELRPLKVWEDGVWPKEYVSTATPSPVITPTPLEQKKTENEGNKTPEKTQSSHDGLGIDSTQQKLPEVEKSGDKSRKRKRDHDTELEESDVSCAVSTTENNGTSANILNNGDVIDETISSWIGNISNGREIF
ncbi:unnamed protein product [Cochlearia groenlandica]